MRSLQILRAGGLSRVGSRSRISNNQVLLGDHTSLTGLSMDERNDGIILDCVGLSAFPDSSSSKLGQLRPKGLYIDAINNGSKENFNVTTDNSNYELNTLANVNMMGFHARSYLVNSQNGSSGFIPSPSSLRVAFGGTKQWTDVPRTTAMFLTKRPFAYEKETKEFLDKTLDKYQEIYGQNKVPGTIVISAHSAGSPHAIKAYNYLKEKGIKSDVQLRLYEPFGAKYAGFTPEEGENVASYICEKSFLPMMGKDGDTLGLTEKLPSPASEKGKKGTLISSAYNSVMAHMLLWVVDSHIDRNTNRDSTSSLESLVSFESMQHFQGGMSR